jgi:H+-transporting ATPase
LALGAAFLDKKHHVIVTSIPAMQDIASISILCSDETGTLTAANMSVIPEQSTLMMDSQKMMSCCTPSFV